MTCKHSKKGTLAVLFLLVCGCAHGGGLQKRRNKAEKRTVVRTLLLTGALPSRFCVGEWNTILPTGITATPAKNPKAEAFGFFICDAGTNDALHAN